MFQKTILILLLLAAPLLAQEPDRVGPFKHAERSVRTRAFDQQHLKIELFPNIKEQSFKGRVTHTLVPFEATKTIKLDAAEMKITAAHVAVGNQWKSLKFQQSKTDLTIHLVEPAAAGKPFAVAIDYEVKKPKHGLHFVEPDPSEPNGHTMFWTQSEPEYARYWVPCIDSPTDRLTSEISATVPSNWFVLSNGVLEEKQQNGEQTTWRWRQKKTHVAYLMSVVAGDFVALEQKWGDVPIISYVPRGRLEQAARSFENTPKMMDYFSRKIGVKYPWPKYAQICVDEYNWGGMEHTSATTLNLGTLHDARAELDTSSEGLVAHELAHQWWGDLLTCKDWGELWLNESFATYFATLWFEHHDGWDEATYKRMREEDSYKGEDKRYRRSIVNYRYNSPSNMFDRHSYPKGGRVLHMLRYELGDELFWKAIRRYAEVNQYRTVETADLRRAVEDATGRGMNWFFDQWVHSGGHPEFQVSWRWDESAKSAIINVQQTQKVDDLTPLFRTSIEFELGNSNAATTRRVSIEKADHTFSFQLDRRPEWVSFDPKNWVLKETTFEKSKQEWISQLQHSQHMPARHHAITALADYIADEDAVNALRATAANDAFWGVRQNAAAQLKLAKGDNARKTLIQVAQNDKKSSVRQAAVESLEKFAHDETKAALRTIIADDESYQVVAKALRVLTKIDRKTVEADLVKAVSRTSHNNAILQAAIDGLAEIKSQKASETLTSLLQQPLEPSRRLAVTRGLAKLKPHTKTVAATLVEQIGNKRTPVRQATAEALAANGFEDQIEALLAHKKIETEDGVRKAIDKTVGEIRKRQTNVDLKAQLEALRKRLEEVEAAK